MGGMTGRLKAFPLIAERETNILTHPPALCKTMKLRSSYF